MASQLEALNRWVDDVAKLTRPDHVHWCDGSEAEYQQLVGRNAGHPATWSNSNQQTHPRLLPAPLRPQGRGARRAPHLRLHDEQGRRRPEQPLDGPGRGPRQDRRAVRGLHGGPHHVRDALLHGPDRFAAVALRRGDHRQPLRGGQHAHHDPHGRRRAGAHRARGHASSRACIRSANSIPSAASSCISPRS